MGRHPEYDRAAALLAAGTVFSHSGYEGTSVDDLVGAIGIHRGSLYKAFGSKNGLFLAAFDAYIEGALADVVGAISRSRTAQEAARVITEHDGVDLLLVAAIERAPHDGDAARLVARALELLGTAWTRWSDDRSGTSSAVIALLGARIVARIGSPSALKDARALARAIATTGGAP